VLCAAASAMTRIRRPDDTDKAARTWSDHDHGPWATGSAAGRKPLPNPAGSNPVYIDAKSLYLFLFPTCHMRPLAPLYNFYSHPNIYREKVAIDRR
jgi:hypothetical protein